MRKAELGEFEHLVLLAVLQLKEEAFAPEIARVLERNAEREMSRGTLYKALERLEKRGFLVWDVQPASQVRGGHRRRSFSLTEAGRASVARQRAILRRMWDGIDEPITEVGA